MDKINEVQVLTNIRLSHAQKFVLGKLSLPNVTPLTAYSSVSNDKNIVANRDVLVKLGMVKLGDNEAEITEKGIAAMQNEGLTDETGNLTDLGEQYAYAKDLEAVEQIAAQEKSPEVPAPEQEIPPETKPMGISSQNVQDSTKVSFESWTMVSDIQNELSEKEFLKNHAVKHNS